MNSIKFETVEFTTYSHLTPVFFNGDESGCTDQDIKTIAQVEAWLLKRGYTTGQIVACSDDSWFSWRPDIGDLGGDVCTYTAMRPKVSNDAINF